MAEEGATRGTDARIAHIGARSPLERVVLLKPGEGGALLLSGAYFFCILFGYYLLRPIRDEFGIRGELSDLPWLWTGTTAAMLAATPFFAWLVSRQPRRRFIPISYRFFAANLLGFYALLVLAPETWHTGIGYGFYIWLSVFNLFAVSIFWGFMADLWTTEQSKRLFAAIGVGGTLGATLGSSVPAFLSNHLGATHLMLAAVVMLEAAVWCVRALASGKAMTLTRPRCAVCGHQLMGLESEAACPGCGSGRRADDTSSAAEREPTRRVWRGFTLIARSPYLLAMCAYMLCYTLSSTFMYFEQARIVKQVFSDADARRAAFAQINLATNIITLLLQLFITGRLVRRLGVIAGLAALPILTLAGFAALKAAPEFGWPIFLTFASVDVARRALHYAVDRPTREMLYTPLGPDEKYKSKSFIDTFVYRGGDLLGAWAQAWKLIAVNVHFVAIGLCVVWVGASAFLAARNRRMISGADSRVAASRNSG